MNKENQPSKNRDTAKQKADWPPMVLKEINGIELEVYDSGGSGEPVLFIHSPTREEWTPVLARPNLANQHRLIHFHRRGYGNSEPSGLPLNIHQQANDCRAVLEHFGIERAHLAALSGGGSILLQYAIDHPDTVNSMAILEPALPQAFEHPEYQKIVAETAPYFESGDMPTGFHKFFQGLLGDDYGEFYGNSLEPGWFDRLMEDQEPLLYDVDALSKWSFTENDAARISAPLLNIKADNSTPFHQEVYEIVKSWIPHAENVVVPDSKHALLQTQPEKITTHLTEFFGRHPIRT